MTDVRLVFAGTIPERYDRYLGPTLFEPYAADLVARIPATARRVLEVACGTGVVTRRLREALPAAAHLTATDLSDAMIAYARAHLPAHPALDFRTADAAALPFGDASFDVVVCQFGFMFVPDKGRAFAEARRVLARGGALFFSVWDDFEHNPVTRIAHETIAALYPTNPPDFYTVPFGFHDRGRIRQLLDDAGFDDVTIDTVTMPSRSPSAGDYAAGLVSGCPMATQIEERGTLSLERVVDTVSRAIAKGFGAGRIEATMRALVVTARRDVSP